MKKNLSLILCGLLLAALFLQLPAAAAPKQERRGNRAVPARLARVAILPTITLQEDIDYVNTLVFQKSNEVFRYPDYEIYEGEKLYKALDEVNYYEEGKKGINEAMLRTIMEKAGLDMIVMVKLNELTQHTVAFGRESTEELVLDMNFVTICTWRDKMLNAHITERKTADYAAIMKTDWKLRECRSAINIQMERIGKLAKK